MESSSTKVKTPRFQIPAEFPSEEQPGTREGPTAASEDGSVSVVVITTTAFYFEDLTLKLKDGLRKTGLEGWLCRKAAKMGEQLLFYATYAQA